jgi:cytoskeleton protein RodZ
MMSLGFSACDMTSIGDRLRQERLRRGLDLYQLAEQTKINSSMLEAIEADDLEKLPGSFFTRSFIRQYARALGLDENELEPELKRVTGFEEPSASEAESIVRPDLGLAPVDTALGHRRPSRHSLGALAAFVLIVAACSLIYTFWQRMREPAKQGVAVTSPAASHKAPAAAVEKPAPAPAPAETAPAATPQEAPAAGTAGGTEIQTPAPAPAGAQSGAAEPGVAPGQETRSSVPPGEAAAVRIQIHATGPAWIRVTADGKLLYSGTLQSNESQTFEGKGRMSLRVGDSAAVRVTWNGKGIGEIGPRSQPRTVQFTPDAFKVLTPAPAPVPAAGDAL